MSSPLSITRSVSKRTSSQVSDTAVMAALKLSAPRRVPRLDCVVRVHPLGVFRQHLRANPATPEQLLEDPAQAVYVLLRHRPPSIPRPGGADLGEAQLHLRERASQLDLVLLLASLLDREVRSLLAVADVARRRLGGDGERGRRVVTRHLVVAVAA